MATTQSGFGNVGEKLLRDIFPLLYENAQPNQQKNLIVTQSKASQSVDKLTEQVTQSNLLTQNSIQLQITQNKLLENLLQNIKDFDGFGLGNGNGLGISDLLAIGEIAADIVEAIPAPLVTWAALGIATIYAIQQFGKTPGGGDVITKTTGGAMNPDATLAQEISKQTVQKSDEDRKKQEDYDKKEQEALADAPWYTRLYGIGRSEWLKKKGIDPYPNGIPGYENANKFMNDSVNTPEDKTTGDKVLGDLISFNASNISFNAKEMKITTKEIQAKGQGATGVTSTSFQPTTGPEAPSADTGGEGRTDVNTSAAQDIDGLKFAKGVDTRIQQGIADKAKAIQADFGPFVITSGYRDPARNAKVGGASGSQHLQGKAIDVSFNGDQNQTIKFIQAAHKAGIGGIGVYRAGSVHIDTGSLRYWGPSYHAGSEPAWAKPALVSHVRGFEKGTRNTSPGPAVVNENGEETLVRKGKAGKIPGGKKTVNLESGDSIIPSLTKKAKDKVKNDPLGVAQDAVSVGSLVGKLGKKLPVVGNALSALSVANNARKGNFRGVVTDIAGAVTPLGLGGDALDYILPDNFLNPNSEEPKKKINKKNSKVSTHKLLEVYGNK